MGGCMKTLVLEAEVKLTEKEFKQMQEKGICWDKNQAIATICNKPVKFVRAFGRAEEWETK